jgi:hypothetical protein
MHTTDWDDGGVVDAAAAAGEGSLRGDFYGLRRIPGINDWQNQTARTPQAKVG